MKTSEIIKKELYESGAMDIYNRIRQKIKDLKKSCGFECKMCGNCCTPNVNFSEVDFFYMKEKGANLEGVETWKASNGSLIPKKSLKHKLSKLGFGSTGICFYEKEKPEITLCKIHPNNPLVYHSFPFVVNLSDKLFTIKENCTWMKKNYENFIVEIKFVEEIKDLIVEYWHVLEKYSEIA